MSLRDQLVAKGLATRKQARRADQEQRARRKQEQSKRRKKRELEAEERAKAASEREARLKARKQQRAEYEEQRAQMERALQIRNTILGNQLHSRGPVPFHHRSVDGRTLHRMHVSSGLAHALRAGDAAIVAHAAGRELEYVAVGRRAAEKLDQLAPDLVVFWNRNPQGLGAPDLGFLERTWEPSLRARRATSADLERLGAGSPRARSS